GTSTEPGTAAFVTSVPERSMHDEIARQLVESGVRVILGGGEQFFLPEGEQGVHGPGKRKDDLNLIELAKQKGYAVVRTRDELLNLSEGTDRVLGLFAADHIFNDMPEELLDVAGKPHYKADAPTVAEMTQAALDVLSAGGSRFLLVVEEEGTDNFGNVNNASGMIQAMKRADDAIGVARTFVAENPRTLILTAADSDGGGMRMIGLRPPAEGQEYPKTLPRWDYNGAPIHGVDGQGTKPYMAAPDRNGRQWPFAIVWATRSDVTGGVLVKGEGLNSHLIRGNMDNTELTQLMRLTLFGGTTPE
ncbi:MAG: alkaline phosphatase, partial [Phycisphaerae bacterium]